MHESLTLKQHDETRQGEAFAANDFHHRESINVVLVVFGDLGYGFRIFKTGQGCAAMKLATAIVDLGWTNRRSSSSIGEN